MQHGVQIALVDDDEDILFSSQLMLSKEFEEVIAFPHPEKLLEWKDDAFQIILLDLNYSKHSNKQKEGLDFIPRIQTKYKQAQIIVLTAFNDLDLAVEAVRKGAYDFITKPWVSDKLLHAINNALRFNQQKQLLRANEELREAHAKQIQPFIGDSAIINDLLHEAAEFSSKNAAILIKGGTGTGKTLLAQHIHQFSKKRLKSFVVVDGQRDSPDVMVQKLEGVKEGTLVVKQLNQGLKLALEKNLGLDTRLIILGDHNLVPEILLHKCFTLTIPDLSKRDSDAMEIAQHYLEKFSEKYRTRTTLTDEMKKEITTYSWPGNVGELKRVMEQLVFTSTLELTNTNNLFPNLPHYKTSLSELEKEHIQKVLNANDYNIMQSAKILGITRASLYRRMDKHNISHE